MNTSDSTKHLEHGPGALVVLASSAFLETNLILNIKEIYDAFDIITLLTI